MPVVIIDRFLDREDIPTVVLDNYRAGAIAAEHLVGLGHRSIGVVTGPQDITLSRERHRGFVATLWKHGLSFPESHVFEGDFKYESGHAAARAFIDRRLPITAVWCHNDLMAVGAMNAFVRHGIRIPEDLSLVGMDDIRLSEMTVPTLTTVTQPFDEMCRRAVHLIVDLRSKRPLDERRIVLAPGIITRESSMPPSPSRRSTG